MKSRHQNNAAMTIGDPKKYKVKEECTFYTWKLHIWGKIRTMDTKKEFWYKIPWIGTLAPPFVPFHGMDMTDRTYDEVSLPFQTVFVP